MREKDSVNNYWKNPVCNDQTFLVEEEQFLLLKVNGELEVDKISGRCFTSMKIDDAFKKMEINCFVSYL